MAKDRARPFSRKHRKYWLTVTGGMLLIGGINIGLGMCAYDGSEVHERIIPVLPGALPADVIDLSSVPGEVMRAFNAEFPRHAPHYARKVDGMFEINFVDNGAKRSARYRADGTR